MIAVVRTNGRRLMLRAMPNIDAQIVDRLPPGRRLKIEKVEGDWLYVRDQMTEKIGWVFEKWVQELPSPIPDHPPPLDIREPSWSRLKTAAMGALFIVIGFIALGLLMALFVG